MYSNFNFCCVIIFVRKLPTRYKDFPKLKIKLFSGIIENCVMKIISFKIHGNTHGGLTPPRFLNIKNGFKSRKASHIY